MGLVLGIDTSCYTTSLALLDTNLNFINSVQLPLEVSSNKGGLRQSEGVFQHTKNLPKALEKLTDTMKLDLKYNITAISVSSKPRPQKESYMPVFLVGDSYASFLRTAFEVPIYRVSHQEGHIAACLYDNLQKIDLNVLEEFYVFHVSGGTTELLECVPSQNYSSFDIKIIGGTRDLAAGQLIDRTANKLGLPFPGGPQLESLSKFVDAKQDVSVPISISDTWVNFSGPETHIKKIINEGNYKREIIARKVEKCVAESLVSILKNASKHKRKKKILFVGGVMSNNYIKKYISRCFRESEISFLFTTPNLSKDNAIGVSLLGHNHLKTQMA
ncbi:O-sialoglycoprotein endopeptidase [Natranaerobius trueperi]|uniref:N(6)-L-threonylcarbamoyladenine synthase n=1 Tax=Natranaerobius trueperi TaxID=759412 RepID=A0A226C0P1_9FIRM|nr:O-sialoglycoprotein endopeptidase [Natranaerobius trueperi]OWZ84019.1 O-sialoglycoprotein endopeptidase [Natranaerobius trueperi]